MVWDPDQPTVATKLRNVPSVITPNWDAIEFGDVPYDKLQLEEQAINPTRQDNTGWLYTKEASTQTELYYEDDRNPAKVIQLTSDGRIGTTTQQILTSGLSFNGTYFNTQNSFVSAWAYFAASASGTVAPTHGFNIADRVRSSTGIYTIRTSNNFLNSSVGVFLATFESSNNPQGINLTAIPTIASNVVSIPIGIRDRSGSHDDLAFYVMVVGGRV